MYLLEKLSSHYCHIENATLSWDYDVSIIVLFDYIMDVMSGWYKNIIAVQILDTFEM